MTPTFSSILASVSLLQVATTESALKPISQWSVIHEPSTCVLSRDFGNAKSRATLSIEPGLMSGEITIAAEIADAGRKTPFKSTATVKIGSYEAIKTLSSSRSTKKKTSIISFDINVQELGLIASSATMTVPLAENLSATMVLDGMTSALQAVETCRTDTLKSWGIDPNATSIIVKRPRAISPEDWVRNSDYPEDALRKHIEGITQLVLAIGVDGRITDCRIVQTSGYETLDRASCTALGRPTHRFTPAENATGQPTLGWTWVSQRWHLPT